jgi:hypothetical protein
MFRKWVLLVVLAFLAAGCGGNKERGKNKFKDRPESEKTAPAR